MIDINEIRKGMILLSHEPDLLWEQEKNKREKVLLGSVISIDYEKREVALRLNRENRLFKPNMLWRLPYEVEDTTANEKLDEKLKGFIVGVYEGRVGTFGLEEVAKTFKEYGIKPIKARELIEAL